jgi:hypothetical protein
MWALRQDSGQTTVQRLAAGRLMRSCVASLDGVCPHSVCRAKVRTHHQAQSSQVGMLVPDDAFTDPVVVACLVPRNCSHELVTSNARRHITRRAAIR